MRIVVLCADPGRAPHDDESALSVLEQLGCRCLAGRFDTSDLDEADIARRPPTLVVVDAGDELARGKRALVELADHGLLGATPTLLAVSLARLGGLDFDVGATDFILKPLVPAEMYARVRQLDWKSAAFGSDHLVKLGELVIDVGGYEARLGRRLLDLTHQEFELLSYLARHRGKAFTRDQLLTRVWGLDYQGGPRTVDIHVRRLRVKLGEPTSRLIETIRNVGYKMSAGAL